jgi:hypothetical protein
MNIIVFIFGFAIFVMYLIGYVLVITNQNKIQDKQDENDPELN